MPGRRPAKSFLRGPGMRGLAIFSCKPVKGFPAMPRSLGQGMQECPSPEKPCFHQGACRNSSFP